ncbi:MAG: helix-turn-helix transcriptional regulator [Armatimonadetes bacterium]|nr:helix-turn-helix transcriptional regulator [Armatimonadota bacterium]
MWSTSLLAKCRHLFERSKGAVPHAEFCDLPKWVFLEYLVCYEGCVLFGANDSCAIDCLPTVKLSANLRGWNERRHFAFSTSAEAIYRAILDVAKLSQLGRGGQSTIAMSDQGGMAPNRFYFGLDYQALPSAPWTNGSAYVFRRSDLPDDFEHRTIVAPKPIYPVLRVPVGPNDWPLLGSVSGVNHSVVRERQWHTMKGYPWTSDSEVHPHLSKRPLAEAVRKYIDERWFETIDLETMGHHVGLSRFGVLRTFRSVFGLSPHEYQVLYRLDRAKELLREGTAIGETAVECGFFDQAHMGRLFSNHIGLTPGAYVALQYRPIA